MSTQFLLTQAFMLELAAWIALYGSLHDPNWLSVVGLHFSASAILSLVAWALLPKKYKLPWQSSGAMIFVFVAFIPIVGSVGTFLAILPGLYKPKAEEQSFSKQTTIPELPLKPVEIDVGLSFADGGLYHVLRQSKDVNKRLKAVLASQRIDERRSIPILQLALKDPVDDVRLLAYSVLDRKENAINLSIEQANRSLDAASGVQRAALHKHLASLYWELVYLDLAQGDVQEHALNSARNHIEQAIEIAADAGSYFLLGRIELKSGAIDDAELAFAIAGRFGMDKTTLASYRAEIAFIRKQYETMIAALKDIPSADLQRKPFSDVARYWEIA